MEMVRLQVIRTKEVQAFFPKIKRRDKRKRHKFTAQDVLDFTSKATI